MRTTRRTVVAGAASLLLAALSLACSATARERVLVYVFDGVPGVKERAQAQAQVEAAAAAEAAARAEAAAAAAVAAGTKTGDGAPRAVLNELPPPPVELNSWRDALEKLPVDRHFGLDWVAAVNDGHVTPVGVVPSGELPKPPFDLDDLGLFAAQIEPSRPVLQLDVELTAPGADALYAVHFPHSSHTLWLSCGSCHPGKLERHPTMAGIFGGASCGRCHGKVAFAPEFECSRCHPALAPPAPEALTAELAANDGRLKSAASEAADGRELYERLCATCHGTEGDGRGPLAAELEIRPRDFRPGEFRFRSTVAPSLPTDEDLYRVVSRGVPNSSMPAFARLPAAERWALVDFVKGFSPRFANEAPGRPVEIPAAPELTAELAARGAEIYRDIGCDACHGATGGGDGRAAPVIRDALGNLNPPLNFESGRPFKSGERPEDVYRVIWTGLEGTPMPGFARALDADRAWALTAFVLSRRGARRAPWAVVGEITFARATSGGEHPPAIFPHWKHRSRLKCSSCHPDLFEMAAGSTRGVDMEAIRAGRFCGACHNGRIAWEAGFATCVKCHAPA